MRKLPWRKHRLGFQRQHECDNQSQEQKVVIARNNDLVLGEYGYRRVCFWGARGGKYTKQVQSKLGLCGKVEFRYEKVTGAEKGVTKSERAQLQLRKEKKKKKKSQREPAWGGLSGLPCKGYKGEWPEIHLEWSRWLRT